MITVPSNALLTGAGFIWAAIGAYLVDQKEVPREVALALKAEDVAAVEVVRAPGQRAKLMISTLNAPVREQPEPAIRVRRRQGTELMEKKMFNSSPLFLIDGVRSTEAALKALDRSAIESIEVLKGRAVLEAFPSYTAEELAGGVISVKMKRTGGE